MERLEGVGLLAGAEELHGQSGHGRDAERRPASGVAVDLRQDQPGQRHRGGKCLRDGDCLLAGHRIDDE